MRTKIYFIVSLVLVLTSCEIRGPEEKPDFAIPGKQMFGYTEDNLNRMCELFDITLKLNTYIEAPDSLKPDVNQKYLANFTVKSSSDSSIWYLYEGSWSDPVYEVITDSKPLTTEGAVWLLKKYGVDSCSVSCLQKNSWRFIEINSVYYYPGTNADLQFTCTDTLTPHDYYSANYQIEGECNTLLEDYSQDVLIECSTVNPLKHKADSYYNFSGGSLLLSAQEDEITHIVTAEYKNVTDYSRTIIMTYDGKSKSYSDL